MKKYVLILLSFIIMNNCIADTTTQSTQSNDDRWINFKGGDEYVLRYDKTSLIKNSSVWIEYKFTNNNRGLSRYNVKCDKRIINASVMLAYDENRQLIQGPEYSNEFTDVIPSTLSEDIYNLVCSKK